MATQGAGAHRACFEVGPVACFEVRPVACFEVGPVACFEVRPVACFEVRPVACFEVRPVACFEVRPVARCGHFDYLKDTLTIYWTHEIACHHQRYVSTIQRVWPAGFLCLAMVSGARRW
jgi:hypothetical protein